MSISRRPIRAASCLALVVLPSCVTYEKPLPGDIAPAREVRVNVVPPRDVRIVREKLGDSITIPNVSHLDGTVLGVIGDTVRVRVENPTTPGDQAIWQLVPGDGTFLQALHSDPARTALLVVGIGGGLVAPVGIIAIKSDPCFPFCSR